MTDVTSGHDHDEPVLSAADEQLLRELTERARTGGLKLTGEGGLLGKLTKMVIQLAFQRALDHHFRELAEQAALAGELQAAGPRPLGQLPQQLLISGRQLHAVLTLTRCHVCYWCLPTCQELHR